MVLAGFDYLVMEMWIKVTVKDRFSLSYEKNNDFTIRYTRKHSIIRSKVVKLHKTQ